MANPKIDIEIAARLDSLDRDFGRAAGMARDTAGKIEGAFTGIGSSLKGVAAGLAGAFSVDLFVGMVRGAVDAQDHINDLNKSTSISVETLAGLGAAARKSGSNLDDVAASVNKLSVNMGKEPEKFAAIGVSAKEPIEALKQLADVFVSIKDPQERAAFAAAALGKSWAGTAPLLAEGGKSIGEMVEKGTRLSKITAESAAKADELNDQLEDLETSSLGLKVTLANALVPSLIATAKGMEEIIRTGNPFAVMMSSLGRQRLSFDPNFASAGTQLKDLEDKLTSLLSQKAKFDSSSGGWINELLIGKKGDIERDILIARNQIESLKKYGDQLGKKSAIEKQTPEDSKEEEKKKKRIRNFLDGDSVVSAQISEGQRLIAQLKDRLLAEERLNEVQKLEAQFADDKYKKMSAGEREIALGIAAQIDARKALMVELDAELAMVKGISKEYEAQDARLKSLISGTDIGKTNQRNADEALAESAFLSGKIDLSTYDQIIEKLRDVKDEGKDAFKELKDAIDGWGKASATAIVDFAMSGKSSFKDMANSIISDMMRMVVQQNITGPLAKTVGGFDWGGLFGSGESSGVDFGGNVIPNAMGNVYNSPSLSAYSGQVLNKPTFFAFANGAGVAGEAGPEGIFPLKRGPDGKLGVSASGAGSSVVVNVINNADGTRATQSRRQDSGGKTIIDVMIETVKGAIAQDIGSGGVVAGAMEQQYSLNRAAGAWR